MRKTVNRPAIKDEIISYFERTGKGHTWTEMICELSHWDISDSTIKLILRELELEGALKSHLQEGPKTFTLYGLTQHGSYPNVRRIWSLA